MIEPEQVAAIIVIIGLSMIGVGAYIAARAARLTDQQAVEVGVSRGTGSTVEENLKLPAVQTLLRQSRGVSRGFWLIFAGVILQTVGTIIPMIV
jgi:hypothetical protein